MKQALLIVDVQNYFINKYTQKIPNLIKTLIEENSFKTILFSQFINTPNSLFVSELNFTGCFKSPYIDIVDDLKSYLKQDNLFTKCAYSVFTNPKFESYLKKNKIDELVLVGLDTDYCVLADAFNAFDKGYKITVISNCTSSYTSGPEGAKNALNILKNIGTII